VIEVKLDQQEFEPGELIEGKLTWSQIRQGVDLEIRLIWFTLGKGSRDYSIVSSQPVAQPKESGQIDFRFEAPDWPHSFSGELISLQWAIEVVELPSEEAIEVELVIAPGRKEIALSGESPNSTPAQQPSTE
jgi:hypothetical protein